MTIVPAQSFRAFRAFHSASAFESGLYNHSPKGVVYARRALRWLVLAYSALRSHNRHTRERRASIVLPCRAPPLGLVPFHAAYRKEIVRCDHPVPVPTARLRRVQGKSSPFTPSHLVICADFCHSFLSASNSRYSLSTLSFLIQFLMTLLQ
jgi:hypothetical protein